MGNWPFIGVSRQKIHVGAFDQLGSLHSEQFQHPIRLSDSVLNRLIGCEDNLELEVVPEIFDHIQMHSGTADEEERSKFPYVSGFAVGQRQ